MNLQNRVEAWRQEVARREQLQGVMFTDPHESLLQKITNRTVDKSKLTINVAHLLCSKNKLNDFIWAFESKPQSFWTNFVNGLWEFPVEFLQWFHEKFPELFTPSVLNRLLENSVSKPMFENVRYLTHSFNIPVTEQNFKTAVSMLNLTLIQELYSAPRFECPKDSNPYVHVRLNTPYVSETLRNTVFNIINFLHVNMFVIQDSSFIFELYTKTRDTRLLEFTNSIVQNIIPSTSQQPNNIIGNITNSELLQIFYEKHKSVLNENALLSAYLSSNLECFTMCIQKGITLGEHTLYTMLTTTRSRDNEFVRVCLNMITDSLDPANKIKIPPRNMYQEYICDELLNRKQYRLFMKYIILYVTVQLPLKQLWEHNQELQNSDPELYIETMIHMHSKDLFFPYYCTAMQQYAEELHDSKEKRLLIKSKGIAGFPRDLTYHYISEYL